MWCLTGFGSVCNTAVGMWEGCWVQTEVVERRRRYFEWCPSEVSDLYFDCCLKVYWSA